MAHLQRRVEEAARIEKGSWAKLEAGSSLIEYKAISHRYEKEADAVPTSKASVTSGSALTSIIWSEKSHPRLRSPDRDLILEPNLAIHKIMCDLIAISDGKTILRPTEQMSKGLT